MKNSYGVCFHPSTLSTLPATPACCQPLRWGGEGSPSSSAIDHTGEGGEGLEITIHLAHSTEPNTNLCTYMSIHIY